MEMKATHMTLYSIKGLKIPVNAVECISITGHDIYAAKQTLVPREKLSNNLNVIFIQEFRR
jgi:Na+-translocating ferredoxin:NAD+ oxidoreductase RnfE subunit